MRIKARVTGMHGLYHRLEAMEPVPEHLRVHFLIPRQCCIPLHDGDLVWLEYHMYSAHLGWWLAVELA